MKNRDAITIRIDTIDQLVEPCPPSPFRKRRLKEEAEKLLIERLTAAFSITLATRSRRTSTRRFQRTVSVTDELLYFALARRTRSCKGSASNLRTAAASGEPWRLDDSRYCPLAAALSPSLIASASLTYLPFFVVP
jgi:hypothetical protein